MTSSTLHPQPAASSAKRPRFDLYQAGMDKLRRMYALGKGDGTGGRKYRDRHSRRPKNRNRQNKRYIYSYATLKSYEAAWRRFCRWLETQKIFVRSWAEAEAQVEPYLRSLQQRGLSVSTLKHVGCALNKLFPGRHLGDYALGRRRRAEVTKSRTHPLSWFASLRENEPDLFLLGLAAGLRRGKELRHLRGTDLTWHDGRWCFRVKGKNGQRRYAPLVGDEQTLARIRRLCEEAGEEKLFPRLPRYDQHVLRAVYACLLYQSLARPVEEIPPAERYCCRRDYAGIILDRRAMGLVSEALGHHRVDVFAQSYLWPLVTMAPEIQAFFGLTPLRR